ncbi:MAG: hypothetical protein KDA80_04995 [Planctomycetaceae bacterium]|nr:hypothetical protein [Planctomycetaceae bacterium]
MNFNRPSRLMLLLSVRFLTMMLVIGIPEWIASAQDTGGSLGSAAPASPARPTTSPQNNAAPSPPSPSSPSTPPRVEQPPQDFRAAYSRSRLARTPEMFGDLAAFGQFEFTDGINQLTGPFPAIADSQKFSDNGHALPRDRFFYAFNYYEDALRYEVDDVIAGIPLAREELAFARHTIGFEKTFFCGRGSVEFRLPLEQGQDYEFNDGVNLLRAEGSRLGNLFIINKWLFIEQCDFALSGGVGFGIPTADSVTATVDSGFPLDWAIENEAVYIHPFLAAIYTPNEVWFYQAHSQVQIAANGNPIVISSGALSSSLGKFNPQTTASLDLMAGRWLFQDRENRFVRDLAAQVELHSTIMLDDPDNIDLDLGGGLMTNLAGIPDDLITNFTAGLHANLSERSNLRFGFSVPVANPQFGFETIVQWNMFY